MGIIENLTALVLMFLKIERRAGITIIQKGNIQEEENDLPLKNINNKNKQDLAEISYTKSITNKHRNYNF